MQKVSGSLKASIQEELSGLEWEDFLKADCRAADSPRIMIQLETNERIFLTQKTNVLSSSGNKSMALQLKTVGRA